MTAQRLLQDYARLHSYKIIATSAVADSTLDNMWNKVGWLLKAYHVRPVPSVLQLPAICGRDVMAAPAPLKPSLSREAEVGKQAALCSPRHSSAASCRNKLGARAMLGRCRGGHAQT